jgi:hypothetical protein
MACILLGRRETASPKFANDQSVDDDEQEEVNPQWDILGLEDSVPADSSEFFPASPEGRACFQAEHQG